MRSETSSRSRRNASSTAASWYVCCDPDLTLTSTQPSDWDRFAAAQYPILAAEDDQDDDEQDNSDSSFDERSFAVAFADVDPGRSGVDLANVRSWVDDDDDSDDDD